MKNIKIKRVSEDRSKFDFTIHVEFDQNKDIAENKNILKYIEEIQKQEGDHFNNELLSFVLDKVLEEKYSGLKDNYWWHDSVYFNDALETVFLDLSKKVEEHTRYKSIDSRIEEAKKQLAKLEEEKKRITGKNGKR